MGVDGCSLVSPPWIAPGWSRHCPWPCPHNTGFSAADDWEAGMDIFLLQNPRVFWYNVKAEYLLGKRVEIYGKYRQLYRLIYWLIEPEVLEEYGILIVPPSSRYGGMESLFRQWVGWRGFLRCLMQSSKIFQRPANRSVGVFAEIWRKTSSRRSSYRASIHMSLGLVRNCRGGSPYNLVSRCTVIDSGFARPSYEVQVVMLLAKEGADLDTVLARIEEAKEKTELYIVAYLPWYVKGGRIGCKGLSSLLTSVVENEGPSVGIVKGRGNKTLRKWLGWIGEKLSWCKVAGFFTQGHQNGPMKWRLSCNLSLKKQSLFSKLIDYSKLIQRNVLAARANE